MDLFYGGALSHEHIFCLCASCAVLVSLISFVLKSFSRQARSSCLMRHILHPPSSFSSSSQNFITIICPATLRSLFNRVLIHHPPSYLHGSLLYRLPTTRLYTSLRFVSDCGLDPHHQRFTADLHSGSRPRTHKKLSITHLEHIKPPVFKTS